VAVKVHAGPVITHHRAWIGVAGRDLVTADAVGGLGSGWITQLRPSHRSASGRYTPEPVR